MKTRSQTAAGGGGQDTGGRKIKTKEESKERVNGRPKRGRVAKYRPRSGYANETILAGALAMSRGEVRGYEGTLGTLEYDMDAQFENYLNGLEARVKAAHKSADVGTHAKFCREGNVCVRCQLPQRPLGNTLESDMVIWLEDDDVDDDDDEGVSLLRPRLGEGSSDSGSVFNPGNASQGTAGDEASP